MWEELFKKVLGDKLKEYGNAAFNFIAQPYQDFGDANRALIAAAMQGRPATQAEAMNMANATVDAMGETGTITGPQGLARFGKKKVRDALESAAINGVQSDNIWKELNGWIN